MLKCLSVSKDKIFLLFFMLFALPLFIQCQSSNITSLNPKDEKLVKHPSWSVNTTIYEVNVRQYTPDGTFKAFALSLPKLKEMGVGILWFMPINPIGVLNRKGTLGSYYSVQDYTAVNPEFGSLEDFNSVVKQAHDLGMHVIIDWVANHTSWDNVWTKTHPDFYTKDQKGKFVSPVADWTDVIDLNYDNKELWNYMRDAMKFWIEECGIDGFRCDVAEMVPLEFWKWVRPQLDSIKPVFMLAEGSLPELHQVFDMTYNWQLKDLFVDCAKGNKSAIDFYEYFSREKIEYSFDSYRMVFTSNHDENTWQGTDKERFGDAAETFAVLTCLVPGMPLVYSGQEAGLNKRLNFFEKDLINWDSNVMRNYYTLLFNAKKENKALWNGADGGELQKLFVNDGNIFAFIREKDNNKVISIFNLSNKKKQVTITSSKLDGSYKNLFTDSSETLRSQFQLTLEPWGYRIFTK
ncbi:MAG: alpha-amylase [Melioribacter sp.]|nr:alpha-amylase [Melioribacter sp.]